MKVFLKYLEDHGGYYVFENAQTVNFSLQNLYIALRARVCRNDLTNMKYDSLYLEKQEDKVLLLDLDNIKQMADINFNITQEEDDFYKAYSEYKEKRWQDMPKLWMSWDNYQEIIRKWNEIREKKPKYVIFFQNDEGYIDLIGKEELSQQDLADIKVEHKKFLKHQIAWKKYRIDHPLKHDFWYSPEDSEFEADWQKYLED